MNRNCHLAVSGGDPQGVGPLVSLRAALEVLEAEPTLQISLFAPLAAVHRAAEAWGVDFDHARLTLHDIPFAADVGTPPTLAGGRASLEALEGARRLVVEGRAHALVTAPLSKEAVAGHLEGFTGHTGYLAERAGCEVLMMLANTRLRVALGTTHLPLQKVAGALSSSLLESQLTLLQEELGRRFGCPEPRIAVLALNPHGGEGGLLGREEEEIIKPALQSLGGEEAGFFGPFSADTFFVPGRFESWDGVLAMYHDQGLIPVKMLSSGDTVNITLGLPYVRTSPDHGTAFDLAPGVLPRWESMGAAMTMALKQVYGERD